MHGLRDTVGSASAYSSVALPGTRCCHGACRDVVSCSPTHLFITPFEDDGKCSVADQILLAVFKFPNAVHCCYLALRRSTLPTECTFSVDLAMQRRKLCLECVRLTADRFNHHSIQRSKELPSICRVSGYPIPAVATCWMSTYTVGVCYWLVRSVVVSLPL